jgi:quercetin dioxygenase-like cupin family protein
MLKLDAEATIDEHAAPHPIDVVCLEGEGFIAVEDQVHTFRAGQAMRWPPHRLHRLWTGDHSMVTLMLERLSG